MSDNPCSTFCSNCNRYSHTVYSARQHQKQCTLKNKSPNKQESDVLQILTCKFETCNKQFHLLKTLINHYNEVHYNSNMQRNALTDELDRLRKMKCSSCNRYFASQLARKIHELKAHPAQTHKFRCNLCTNSFHTERRLSIHKLYKHGQNDSSHGKFSCTGCREVFLTPARLLRHIETQPISRMHNGYMYREAIYNMKNISICAQCNILYYTKENYIQHQRMKHSKEDLARCICKVYSGCV